MKEVAILLAHVAEAKQAWEAGLAIGVAQLNALLATKPGGLRINVDKPEDGVTLFDCRVRCTEAFKTLHGLRPDLVPRFDDWRNRLWLAYDNVGFSHSSELEGYVASLERVEGDEGYWETRVVRPVEAYIASRRQWFKGLADVIRANSGRPLSVDDRMALALKNDPSRWNWSQKQWADELGCTRAAVANTKTWKQIIVIRAEQKLDRQQSTPRRTHL